MNAKRFATVPSDFDVYDEPYAESKPSTDMPSESSRDNDFTSSDDGATLKEIIEEFRTESLFGWRSKLWQPSETEYDPSSTDDQSCDESTPDARHSNIPQPIASSLEQDTRIDSDVRTSSTAPTNEQRLGKNPGQSSSVECPSQADGPGAAYPRDVSSQPSPKGSRPLVVEVPARSTGRGMGGDAVVKIASGRSSQSQPQQKPHLVPTANDYHLSQNVPTARTAMPSSNQRNRPMGPQPPTSSVDSPQSSGAAVNTVATMAFGPQPSSSSSVSATSSSKNSASNQTSSVSPARQPALGISPPQPSATARTAPMHAVADPRNPYASIGTSCVVVQPRRRSIGSGGGVVGSPLATAPSPPRMPTSSMSSASLPFSPPKPKIPGMHRSPLQHSIASHHTSPARPKDSWVDPRHVVLPLSKTTQQTTFGSVSTPIGSSQLHQAKPSPRQKPAPSSVSNTEAASIPMAVSVTQNAPMCETYPVDTKLFAAMQSFEFLLADLAAASDVSNVDDMATRFAHELERIAGTL